VLVWPQWRRRGLATTLYRLIEWEQGRPFSPAGSEVRPAGVLGFEHDGGAMMRKAIGLLLAMVMLCGGGYLLFVQLSAPVIYGKFILMGGMLTSLGGLWLWSDYIGPIFGRGGGM